MCEWAWFGGEVRGDGLCVYKVFIVSKALD